MSERTSLITILSSTHGRLRREQRDIDKRDLQTALKYGTTMKVWKNRWRIEYDGIVFITDEAMRREIASFPAPLAEAPVETSDRLERCSAIRDEKDVLVMIPTPWR